jgi:hypothetical protein
VGLAAIGTTRSARRYRAAVQREPARLVAAAGRVQADLRRTTGHPWTCTIDDDLVLTVSDGVRSEQLALVAEVEDEAWYAPAGATPGELGAGLDADADEVVGTEVAEALRALGLSWPVCADHARVLGNCSGAWCCPGEPQHDIAEAGQLPGGAAGARPVPDSAGRTLG